MSFCSAASCLTSRWRRWPGAKIRLVCYRDPARDVIIEIPREGVAHYVVGEFIAADDENIPAAIKKEFTGITR